MTKILQGVITSTKLLKTVTVKVERKYRHRIYNKVVKTHKKYLVDNPKLKLVVGDLVTIQAVRPISKNKHYQVIGKK